DWISRRGEGSLIFRAAHPENQGRGRPSTYDKWYASEKELYKVILGSGMARAGAFVDWICGTVLPSIRKHGCFPPPAHDGDPTLILLRQQQTPPPLFSRLDQT